MTGFELLKLAKTLHPGWQFTVEQPFRYGDSWTKGYTQIDNVVGPESGFWSSNPPAMRQRGYIVPNVSDFHTGRYRAVEAANRKWRLENMGRVMPSEYGMHSLEGALSLANKPAPMLTSANKLDMARMLNSWRRNQMRTNPGMAQAYRRLRSPANWSLLKLIGNAARIAR